MNHANYSKIEGKSIKIRRYCYIKIICTDTELDPI